MFCADLYRSSSTDGSKGSVGLKRLTRHQCGGWRRIVTPKLTSVNIAAVHTDSQLVSQLLCKYNLMPKSCTILSDKRSPKMTQTTVVPILKEHEARQQEKLAPSLSLCGFSEDTQNARMSTQG